MNELVRKQKEIADLHVLIDTLQTNLRSVTSYLTEEQKKEVNTPSYRWCIQWKPKNDYQI
jgi:hypothetical protein